MVSLLHPLYGLIGDNIMNNQKNQFSLKEQEKIMRDILRKRVEKVKFLLLSSLTEIDEQVQRIKKFIFILGLLGCIFIGLSIFIICVGSLKFGGRTIVESYGNGNDSTMWDMVGSAIPATMFLLFIGIFTLRHQKKLYSELRYFIHLKYQLNLICNLLEASQYIVMEAGNVQKTFDYVEQTFTSIRNQLLIIENSSFSGNTGQEDDGLLTKILELVPKTLQKDEK